MDNKIYKIGILGATGIVGQRFIELLSLQKNKFKIEVLGASEKSLGKKYKDISKHIGIEIDEDIQNKILKSCIPENFRHCDLVFSALGSESALDIERTFFLSDIPVISNSSCYRLNNEVPLILPNINNDHLQLVNRQRAIYDLTKGFLITNANCVVTGLIYAIFNLHKKFGIKQMNIVTMQAISGAGYSGVYGYDISNNVIPFISNEEDKLKTEPLKILGTYSDMDNTISSCDIQIDATCNRVNVVDGHTSSISLKFEKNISDVNIESIKEIIVEHNNCIKIHDQCDRPQPRLDCNFMNGFGISIGRLRKGNYWDLEMTIVSNNTILGAAGSSILIAELCISHGLV